MNITALAMLNTVGSENVFNLSALNNLTEAQLRQGGATATVKELTE